MQINNIKTDFSFKAHFITFISQALRTILIDFYEYITDDGNFISFSKYIILEQFHDLNVIPLKLINYINYCWHLYNKVERTDDYIYIISKLDKIKFTGKFKHNYCLFDLIWNFSLKALIYILGRIDIETIEKKDFKIRPGGAKAPRKRVYCASAGSRPVRRGNIDRRRRVYPALPAGRQRSKADGRAADCVAPRRGNSNR